MNRPLIEEEIGGELIKESFPFIFYMFFLLLIHLRAVTHSIFVFIVEKEAR